MLLNSQVSSPGKVTLLLSAYFWLKFVETTFCYCCLHLRKLYYVLTDKLKYQNIYLALLWANLSQMLGYSVADENVETYKLWWFTSLSKPKKQLNLSSRLAFSTTNWWSFHYITWCSDLELPSQSPYCKSCVLNKSNVFYCSP